MSGTRPIRSSWIWGLSVCAALVAITARAEEKAYEMPTSSVDRYRVESQYGPQDSILNPIFPQDDKVEVSLGGAYSPVSSLMNYGSIDGSVVYHINRRHAIEPIWFGYAFGKTTHFVDDNITNKTDASFDRSQVGVEIPRRMWAASYLFSPYYSKMHITERTVVHFDVYLGVGPALVQTQERMLNGVDGTTHNRPAASFAAGLRFLYGARWAARLELRDFVHSAENFNKTTLGNTMQFGLSASIFFGSFPDVTTW